MKDELEFAITREGILEVKMITEIKKNTLENDMEISPKSSLWL